MLKEIKKRTCYDNIRGLAQEIGFDKFKKWAKEKYSFTDDDWNGFVIYKMDKNTNIGLGVFSDWFQEQKGVFSVEYVNDLEYGSKGFIHVIDFGD